MFWNRPRRRFRSRRFRLPPAASRSAGPSRDRRPRRRMSPRTGRSSRWSSVAACMYPTRNASISKSWILLRMSGWMKWSGPMTARPSTTRGRTRVGPTSSGSRPTEAPANRPYSCRKTTPRACRPTENAKSSCRSGVLVFPGLQSRFLAGRHLAGLRCHAPVRERHLPLQSQGRKPA